MFSRNKQEQAVLDHIRARLTEQVALVGAPEDMHGFLIEDWAQLMSAIFLNKGNQHPDWEAGWETLNTLLWSLSPRQSREETLHLINLLPGLISRLHEACTALGYDRLRRDRLFSTLAMLHAAVVRAGLQNPGAAGNSKAGPLPAPTFGAEAENGSGRAAVHDLEVGDWLEFHLPEGKRLLRLEWISPQQGMYLFANDQGLNTLTLTRLRLLGRLNAGDVRILR